MSYNSEDIAEDKTKADCEEEESDSDKRTVNNEAKDDWGRLQKCGPSARWIDPTTDDAWRVVSEE